MLKQDQVYYNDSTSGDDIVTKALCKRTAKAYLKNLDGKWRFPTKSELNLMHFNSYDGITKNRVYWVSDSASKVYFDDSGAMLKKRRPHDGSRFMAFTLPVKHKEKTFATAVCIHCKEEFKKNSSRHKICSDKCRDANAEGVKILTPKRGKGRPRKNVIPPQEVTEFYENVELSQPKLPQGAYSRIAKWFRLKDNSSYAAAKIQASKAFKQLDKREILALLSRANAYSKVVQTFEEKESATETVVIGEKFNAIDRLTTFVDKRVNNLVKSHDSHVEEVEVNFAEVMKLVNTNKETCNTVREFIQGRVNYSATRITDLQTTLRRHEKTLNTLEASVKRNTAQVDSNIINANGLMAQVLQLDEEQDVKRKETIDVLKDGIIEMMALSKQIANNRWFNISLLPTIGLSFSILKGQLLITLPFVGLTLGRKNKTNE